MSPGVYTQYTLLGLARLLKFMKRFGTQKLFDSLL